MLRNQNPIKSSAFILALCLCSAISQAESEHDFRVSGVMQIGEKANQKLGLLEFSDGKTMSVRIGDSVSSLKVTGFSGNCIEFSNTDKTTSTKCLTDSAVTLPTAATQSAQQPKQAVTNPIIPPPIGAQDHFKQVDKIEFLQTLDRLAKAKSMKEVSQSIMPLVMLPADTKITELDAQKITSTQNAVNLMRKSVEADRPIRLSLDPAPNNLPVIYLQATKPQNP
jgi:hypothetical protein